MHIHSVGRILCLFRTIKLLLVAAAIGTTTQAAAQGNPWDPAKPLTIVVPLAAGGAVDAVARVMAKAITVAYGQPVVVENLGGADGLIGTRRVINAPADGHTLLLQLPSIVVMRHLPSVEGVDPLASLEPITSAFEAPVLIVSSSQVPANNLSEWAEHCRQSKTPCTTGTGEILGRLRLQQFASEAGIANAVNLNYRGTFPALMDLAAGRIQLSVTTYPSVAGFVREGTVRILAVQDAQRSPMFPDIPTTGESGFLESPAVSWYGVFAPKGTPKALLRDIAVAIQNLRDDPSLQETIKSQSLTLTANMPEEFALQIQKEDEFWTGVVKHHPLN